MGIGAITLTSPTEIVIDDGHALGRLQRPVQREQYLHRFGSHATLMVVEWLKNSDGSLRRSVQYFPWPGL